MKITIRQGVKKDLPLVLKLIKELADYEKSLDEVTITLQDLENDGFGDRPYYQFLIAEDEKKIIGLSFYFIRYSTWKGKILHLEDFVITEEYRNKGVGSLLFKKTVAICKKLNLNAMTWQVLDWNEPAINFYKKHKADFETWLHGMLTKEQIQKMNHSEKK